MEYTYNKRYSTYKKDNAEINEDAFQKVSALPTAGGNKHYLQPRSSSGVYKGHSINSVIEAFSKPTIGHITNNISGTGSAHAEAYRIQIAYPTWNGTTSSWKEKVIEGMDIQLRKSY